MDSMYVILLYFAIYIIEATVQISTLINLQETKLIKYLGKFKGITFIIFVTTILMYNICSYNYPFACIGAVAFILFCNIILLIIGNMIKNKIPKSEDISESEESNYLALKWGAIVLVCNLIILVIIPMCISKTTMNNGTKYIVEYLEKKYGDGNYEVVNINKEYDRGWNNDLIGFCYEIKSDYMDNTFIVEVSYNNSYILEDYFLPVYYSEKYNLQYELYYDSNANDVSSNFAEFNKYIEDIVEEKFNDRLFYQLDAIPENYGKIPSINELADLIYQFYHK